MKFDPENPVVKLCAEGIQLETQSGESPALAYYQKAWQIASTPEEKYIAAHYVARQQATIQQKLEWDLLALQNALLIEDSSDKGHLPSLYLNVAKCYEDLEQFQEAQKQYALAQEHAPFLSDDGYGTMIRQGIAQGIKRVAEKIV